MESERLISVRPSRAALRELSQPGSARPDVGVMQLVLSLGTGGTERLVLEICRRVRSRFRVIVCTLDEPGIWAQELADFGIEVVPMHRRAGFHPSLGRRVAELAAHHRTGVVHCHHYSPFVYGCIATLLRPSLRMVFTEHGRLSDGLPSPKRRLVNPFLGRIPDSMFAVSRALRASMIAEGFPASRVGVVHNGIEPGPAPTASARQLVRQRLGLSASALVIGTIARLDPVKDLGTLIEAFTLLGRTCTDRVLVIVGDGAERTRLEELAHRCGISSSVRFLGQRDDARHLLPGFDVYVNSSTSEGISLTILEAMAAERPVVATQVGGTPEVLVDGVSGLLVPSRNAAALADALAALAAAPLRRRSMGEAGRLAVTRAFSIDRMVEQYAQLYLRLAS